MPPRRTAVTKIHMTAESICALSGTRCTALNVGRATEGNETGRPAYEISMAPLVPPKSRRRLVNATRRPSLGCPVHGNHEEPTSFLQRK